MFFICLLNAQKCLQTLKHSIKVFNERLFDVFYFQLHCCGTHGFDDYKNTTKWDKKVVLLNSAGKAESVTAVVPLSCCRLEDPSKFPNELDKLKFKDAKKCVTAPTNATAYEQVCIHSSFQIDWNIPTPLSFEFNGNH